MLHRLTDQPSLSGNVITNTVRDLRIAGKFGHYDDVPHQLIKRPQFFSQPKILKNNSQKQ